LPDRVRAFGVGFDLWCRVDSFAVIIA
jgi:hypothetical protein